MSWSPGLQLLVTVLVSKDYSILSRNMITKGVLRPEEASLLAYINRVYENPRTRGSLPSIEEAEKAFPSLRLHEIPEHPDPDYLSHKIHEEVLAGKLKAEAIKMSALAQTDPYAALDRIQQLAYELSQEHERNQTDTVLTNMADEIGTYLYNVIDSGGLLGAPWPWEQMNAVTQGAKKGDFILFYGRPKSAKTHLTLAAAVNMYLRGYRILWVNIEMTSLQISTRAAICANAFNYEQVMRNPTREQIEDIKSQLHTLAIMDEAEGSINNPAIPKRFIITSVSTVEMLRAKVMQAKPDVIFVDTANDLKSTAYEGKKEHLVAQHIVRCLRDITRDKNLGCPPVIASAHANRLGDKEVASGYSDIGGTDQWGKTCDLVLRVVRLFDPVSQRWVVAILPPVSGGREVVWDGMMVTLTPYTDMTYLRDTTKEEVMEIIDASSKKKKKTEERPMREAPRRRRRPTQNDDEVSLDDASWMDPE